MSALSFIPRLLCLCLACMSMVLPAHAEWAELMKDDDITYVWDKDSVRAIHPHCLDHDEHNRQGHQST